MRRPIICVLLAGFAAMVAALVVCSALKQREHETGTIGRLCEVNCSVEIVVAAHDLTIGSKLDQNSTKTTLWSRDSIPPFAFTEPGSVMGLYTKTDFVENEPIVADRLTKSPNSAKIPSPVD